VSNINKLSIVIPVYNNVGSINQLLNQIKSELEKNCLENNTEIILLDDCSTDDSINEMLAYKKDSKLNIVIVKFKKNHGQTFAVKTGFTLATGDAILTLSADLQDRTSLISDFIDGYKKGSKIVIAVRANREDGILRKTTSSLAYLIAKLRSPNLPSGGFDCYLISKKIANKVLELHQNTQFIQGVISEFDTPIRRIYYVREARKHGKSQWTYAKKFFLIWSILLDNSKISPITIIKLFYFGFLFSISSFIFTIIFNLFNISSTILISIHTVSFILLYLYIHSKFKKIYEKHDFSNLGADTFSIV
jgi:dolichol-phosphate mannosyltransferase